MAAWYPEELPDPQEYYVWAETQVRIAWLFSILRRRFGV